MSRRQQSGEILPIARTRRRGSCLEVMMRAQRPDPDIPVRDRPPVKPTPTDNPKPVENPPPIDVPPPLQEPPIRRI
jgi:hypothetical protein